jgi:hypothetical protein
MSNPTTPFGWQMPTATDLVTDLPADFEVFGQAVATSMADLLGGTTGQVLAKNSNTDMDFVWVAQDDSNAIQNTIVDAKGDLIAASAADTPARLAVGANGETLVADSSTSTGLRWQGDYAAGKNKIINGDFGVWQRGTSFSNPGNGDYTTDRFKISYNGTGATRTVSQQTFTPGTAPVAGYEGQYFYRVAQTVAGTSQTFLTPVIQRIENVQTLAGQTATLSFWAKAGANISISGGLVQNFGSGGSSSVNTSVGTHNLTTSWQRFTATVSIPSISGKTIGTSAFLELYFDSGSPTAVQTLDFWGFQLEASNTATAFQTATGTIQGELAACQRYYYRQPATSVYAYMTGMWTASTTSIIDFGIQFPVTMRTTPSSFDYSTLLVSDQVNIYAASGTFAGRAENTPQWGVIRYTHGSGVFTQFRPYLLQANNSTSAYLGFSAEL